MKILFYPQFVLGFWGPLLVFGVWQLLRAWRTTLPPQTRFWLSWSVLVFPLLALFVPYLPDLVLRDLLPYRVPIAWGVFNSPDITASPFWVALTVHLPFFLTFGGLLLAFALGVVEELTAYCRVARLPSIRVGRVWVLHTAGDAAFTLGVLRPRVYLSESLWHGPHREAILAHERAHARARHPLLLSVARFTARVWWYVPFVWAALRELELAAELCADEASVRTVGKARLAGALRLGLSISPSPRLAFGSPVSVMRARAGNLRNSPKPLHLRFLCLLIPLYLLLLILF